MPSGRISAAKSVTAASLFLSAGAAGPIHKGASRSNKRQKAISESEAMRRRRKAGGDVVEAAVVREEVHAAAQLAGEGLGIGVGVGAASGAPDMGDQMPGRQRALLDEGHPRAVARRFRLLVEADVAALVEGDTPTIDVAAVRRPVGGKALQRKSGAGGAAAGQAEEFAHAAHVSTAATSRPATPSLNLR